jgi:uncharacterized cupin superfamily protein
MKPIINLDELVMESHASGAFAGSFGGISEHIGAARLGYNLTVCPPGKSVCAFHNHHAVEEMFFILSGTGTLRFGANEYPLRKHDVIACPPGGRDVAHQITNTGAVDLVYLALSNSEIADACEYPDSDKIGVFAGPRQARTLRLFFGKDAAVDYDKVK